MRPPAGRRVKKDENEYRTPKWALRLAFHDNEDNAHFVFTMVQTTYPSLFHYPPLYFWINLCFIYRFIQKYAQVSAFGIA
jgi:hypothetical protein